MVRKTHVRQPADLLVVVMVCFIKGLRVAMMETLTLRTRASTASDRNVAMVMSGLSMKLVMMGTLRIRMAAPQHVL